MAPYAKCLWKTATPLLTPPSCGKRPKKVLMDYLGQQEASEDSSFAILCDQTIPALVANVSAKGIPAYLVMVPPVHTVILRSFLSFETVTLGHKQLIEGLKTYLPWFSELASNTKSSSNKDKLEGWGLLRASTVISLAQG